MELVKGLGGFAGELSKPKKNMLSFQRAKKQGKSFYP